MARVEAETFGKSALETVALAASGQPEEDKPAVSAGQALTGVGQVQAEPEPVAGQDAQCAKCQQTVKIENCVERRTYRESLRWVCKSCHALTTQCQRRGLQLNNLLSEASLVSFYSEAALERKEAEEGRLTFSRARAVLKRLMIEQTKHERRDGTGGEYQPLSWYELRGYDTDKIEKGCHCEQHPVLGPVYCLKIHHQSEDTYHTEVEERISKLESVALQKKQSKDAAAVGVPLLDLDLALEQNPSKGKGKRQQTPEEREELKRQKTAAKAQEKDRKAATAAAAKFLPALKAVGSKLDEKLKKMTDALDKLPEATKDQVKDAQESLKEHTKCASTLLEVASKGAGSDKVVLLFTKDKDLQNVVKSGNAALRSLNEFCRAQKAASGAKPKKAGKNQ